MKTATPTQLPVVVLVHGLLLGRPAMVTLARRLRREGFEVHCFGYNTVTGTLATSTAKLLNFIEHSSRPVALVGHSLGGIVSLQTAQSMQPGKLAAIVLLGCPYQGAAAGRILQRITGGSKSRFGRALHEWAAFDQKPTADVPVFVLAGSLEAGIGRLIVRFKTANDGTVSVAETHYPGATTCLHPVSHTGMLFSRPVAHQVASWLQTAC